MRTLAKWHIWLGWLVGVPIAMWLATGLLMVSRPIEEVRGDHLRRAVPEQQALAIPGSTLADAGANPAEMHVTMQDGRAVAVLIGLDGSVRRVDFASPPEPPCRRSMPPPPARWWQAASSAATRSSA